MPDKVYGPTLLIAGIAAMALGAVQLRRASDIPFVLVGAAVIAAALWCIGGGLLAVLRGRSGSRQVFVAGNWVMVVGFVTLIVRVVHAYTTDLIPPGADMFALTDQRPDAALAAMMITGAGMIGIAVGADQPDRPSWESRSVLDEVIAICGGLLAFGTAIMILVVSF